LREDGGVFMETAEGLDRIAERFERIGSETATRVVSGFASLSSVIGQSMSFVKEMPGLFAEMQAAGIATAVGIGLAMHVALNAIALIADAINVVVGLFGGFDDDVQDVAKGIDRVFEELENSLDQWADRLTDVIVEFVKTGEFEMEQFVASVMEDILRITIRYAFIEPLVEGISGAFAKGAVFKSGDVVPFASGAVVASPTYFPMKGGKTGLMGENDPEAIMPLKRTASGALGVQASGGGGGTTVNVIDQRSSDAPPVSVKRSRDADGREEIRVLISDVVKEGILGGEFDSVNELAFGLSRGGF